jgi:serine protease Do
MRTDAAVNHGNSGGGLFNDKGEVIGIVNAKNTSSATDNIGYAIPSNVAKAVAENILYYCDGKTETNVYRCMLGITVGINALTPVYDTETGKVYKNETVVVKELTSNSAVAGLLQEGDVINSITIDGVKRNVTRTYHVIDTMLYARVGSSVIINVTRGGEAKDVTIPITKSMLKIAEETLE